MDGPIAEHLNVVPKETSDWQKFQLGVSEEALYDDDQLVTNILHSMVKLITCFHDFWIYEFFSRKFLCFVFLNFGYSEKHKEFEKIFHLDWSKYFVPDQKFIYILWQSQIPCARQKDDLHSVNLVFVPAQKVLKRH